MKQLLLIVTMLAMPLFGQQANIQGIVRDSKDASIPGAAVTVVNTGTGVSQKVMTNEAGLYSVPFLVPGTYSVRAEAGGFATKTLAGLTLDVGATVRADLQLEIGTVETSVRVSASVALLNTETSVVGQVIDNQRIVELPLDDRNYLTLAMMTPGAVPTDGARNGATGAFAAVGSRASQVSVLLDGVDNSSRVSGGQLSFESQAVTPSVDAVQEFRVVTNNNSAEFGFRMGGTVMVQTKSGSNQLHGSLYEFLRNDKLAANNFFANRAGADKTVYKRNQFGATGGGRIVKDKTFFFVSYEGKRSRTGEVNSPTVPTPAYKAGDFALDNFKIYDPATTTTVAGRTTRNLFPNNAIPKTRIDPIGSKLASWYPDPTLPGPTRNFFFSPVNKLTTNQIDGRFDHMINSSNRAFVRYSRRGSTNLDPGLLPFPADSGWINTDLIAHSYVGNLNTIVSPAMNNEFRFGYTRNDTIIDVPSTANPQSLGIKGIPDFGHDNDHGIPNVAVTNYSNLGSANFWPNANIQNVYHISNQLTRVQGRHLLKAGMEFRQEMVFRRAARFSRGLVTFNASFTQDPNARATSGESLADLLLGWAGAATISNITGEKLQVRSYAAFIQDDFKITPRLTLNLGARWDRFGIPAFSDLNTLPVSYIKMGTPYTNQYTLVRPKGDGDCGCIHANKNFAPRVGLAYLLRPSTVLRTGYGLFYGTVDVYDQSAVFHSGPPDYAELGLPTDRLVQPSMTLADGFPGTLLTSAGFPANLSTYTSEAFRPSQYTMHYFFDVQQKLPGDIVLTVSYLGSQARKMVWTRNLNGLSAGPGVAKSRQLYPFFNLVTYLQPGGNSNYNGLAVKAEKRFSKGMTFLGSYAWSHVLDNGGGALGDGVGTWRDPNNISLDRSSGNYDRRHTFVGNYIYDLPFGRRQRFGASWNRVIDGILGGWQLGGILTFRTGQLFTPTLAGNPSNSTGTSYPDRLRSGALPSGGRSIDNWFDLKAFAIPVQFTYGNSGRNILNGPGTTNEDIKIGKNFYVRERYRVEFRVEMFNMTNTPNFGLPNAQVNNVQAGKIGAAAPPRAMQFGLKLMY